jgi:hypothetical protein
MSGGGRRAGALLPKRAALPLAAGQGKLTDRKRARHKGRHEEDQPARAYLTVIAEAKPGCANLFS